MSLMMMLAASGARETVSQTFSANATWVAPPGVTAISTLSGKGQNGTAATYSEQTISLVDGSQKPDQVGGASISASSALEPAGVDSDKFLGSGDRTISYTFRRYLTGPDNLTTVVTSSRSVSVRGSRTSSVFNGSGTLTYDSVLELFARVSILVRTAGTTGTSATGLGKTFPGGASGPATVTTFSNVPVTPGTSYPLVIPSGGSITITYLK